MFRRRNGWDKPRSGFIAHVESSAPVQGLIGVSPAGVFRARDGNSGGPCPTLGSLVGWRPRLIDCVAQGEAPVGAGKLRRFR